MLSFEDDDVIVVVSEAITALEYGEFSLSLV